MKIQTDVTLPFSVDVVFSAYRDHLPELTPYLPNIKEIKVLERKELPGELSLVNEWTGGGEFPKALQAVLSGELLKWTDYATWKNDARICEWRTEINRFPGAVKSSGVNRFTAQGGSTRLEINGDLTVDAGKIPGVPRLLAGTIGGALEKFLQGQISLNLVEVAKGVGKYLEATPAK